VAPKEAIVTSYGEAAKQAVNREGYNRITRLKEASLICGTYGL
jgi:hypothetical protein